MSAPVKRALNQDTSRDASDTGSDTINSAKPTTLATARPSLPTRPSWIGPQPAKPPVSPGGTTMKFPVVIDFESPGLQPPVFICTSLTDPQWTPVAMEHRTKEDGVHHFTASFHVEEGEYQYKLRLGPGDWWVCDETKATVDDGAGNKNNQIIVKADLPVPVQPMTADAQVQPLRQEPQNTSGPPGPGVNVIPLIPEAAVVRAASTDQSPAPSAQGKSDPIDESEHLPPFLPHKTAHSTHAGKQPDDDLYVDSEEEPHNAPLLRHETLSHVEGQGTTPSLPHGTIVVDDMKHGTSSRPETPSSMIFSVSNNSSEWVEGGSKQPFHFEYPTDREETLRSVEPTKAKMQGDMPVIEVSPPGEVVLNESTPLLPDVNEAEDELESLPTVEEQSGAEDATPQLDESDVKRPAEPMTPPLTPEAEALEDEQEALVEGLSVRVAEAVIMEAVVEADVQKAVKPEKTHARHTHSPNFSGLLLGLGFTTVVVAIALGLWLTGGRGDMVE